MGLQPENADLINNGRLSTGKFCNIQERIDFADRMWYTFSYHLRLFFYQNKLFRWKGSRNTFMYGVKDLYDLSHSLAGEYLAGFAYPWEALKGIKEFIVFRNKRKGGASQ